MSTQLKLFAASTPKLRKQKRLLEKCARDGTPLHEALSDIGWSYDDLQYEVAAKNHGKASPHYDLSHFSSAGNKIPVVSFFSGAGGLDLGLEAAGFSHEGLVEHTRLFCDTLRHNRPSWRVLGPPTSSGDVSAIDDVVAALEPRITAAKGFDGLFVGGPPCQPFSIAANQRFNKSGKNFKRVGFAHEKNGNLLFDFIDIISKFKPAAFLIENVPGLRGIDNGQQLKRAYEKLEKSGYQIHRPLVLSASAHFVPQSRTRLFIIGNRLGRTFAPPKPSPNRLSCGGIFQISLDNVTNHLTRNHSAESVLRYMQLDLGARDQLGRVDRLDPALPSKTVIAGGTSGGGRSHLHPYIPRTLSVRESARLQTFPDNYEFLGPSARQFTQVGNAVPPVLAAQLGLAILDSIFRKKTAQ